MEFFIFHFSFFIFGSAVGSFLNVVIDRLQTNESISKGRSHCDSCKHVLRWYDLIPIFSFLWLWGKCRYCGAKLRWQYPLVEFSTGIVFLFGFLKFINHESFLFSPPASPSRSEWWAGLFSFLFIASAMIVIFVYDLKHKIIPDKIVLPALIISSFFTFYFLLFTSAGASVFWSRWFSAIGAASFFLALIIATRGMGMGMGDVKLVFLMGLILGWPQILIALYLSFITGALVGLILIAIGKKRFGQEIPFGPFLSASTIITLLYGNFLLHLIVVASP